MRRPLLCMKMRTRQHDESAKPRTGGATTTYHSSGKAYCDESMVRRSPIISTMRVSFDPRSFADEVDFRRRLTMAKDKYTTTDNVHDDSPWPDCHFIIFCTFQKKREVTVANTPHGVRHALPLRVQVRVSLRVSLWVSL